MKNMKKCFLLFLTVFSFAASPAQHISLAETLSDNVNETALKELILESEENLDLYRFTLAQNQQIETINLTTGNTIRHASIFTLGAGAFNLTAKAAKVDTSSLSYSIGEEENATALASETYVVNDTLYSHANGSWISLNLALPESVWTAQDRLNQSEELTDSSDIRLLGKGVIDGESVYIIEVIPKSGAISSAISNQLGPGFSISSINLGSLFNNTRVRYILWISMNSRIPVAEYVQINMTIKPETLGLPIRGIVEDHIDSVTALRFSGFNRSVSIVLPEQARQARVTPLTHAPISPSESSPFQGPASLDRQPPDPPIYSNISSMTPEIQQQIWLMEAYRFLNGDFYPYGIPFYGSPNMPYFAGSFYPYYIPYYPYTMSYAPYSPYMPYAPYTSPAQGYAAPALGYQAPTPGYALTTASNSSIGTYLTDGRGMTLYHLSGDQGSYTSKCTDASCTGIWPPFFAPSTSVPANLDPADFGAIIVNGYKQYQQTTYKGWPLYYFYRDMKPGDIYGQGLRDSYGVWSAVSPEIPNTFPANFLYQSGGAASIQYQYPVQQQQSAVTISPTPAAYASPSLYPPMPTPRPVTTPVSGNVPVTVSYPGSGPFDVYLDGNYIGTGSGGSFSIAAPAGVHDMRVWDGSFDYEQSVLLESGVPKIIYVQAV